MENVTSGWAAIFLAITIHFGREAQIFVVQLAGSATGIIIY